MKSQCNPVSLLLLRLALLLAICEPVFPTNHHPTYYFPGEKHHYHDYNPGGAYYPYKSNSYEEHSDDPYYHLYHPHEKHEGYYYCNDARKNLIHEGSYHHQRQPVTILRPTVVEERPIVQVIETAPVHISGQEGHSAGPVQGGAPIVPITINNFPPPRYPEGNHPTRPHSDRGVNSGTGPVRPGGPLRPGRGPDGNRYAGGFPGNRRRPIAANPRRPVGAGGPRRPGAVVGNRRPGAAAGGPRRPGNRRPPGNRAAASRNFPQNPLFSERRPGNRPNGRASGEGSRRRPQGEGGNTSNINYNK